MLLMEVTDKLKRVNDRMMTDAPVAAVVKLVVAAEHNETAEAGTQ